jgi:DNA topoisomerase-1
MDQRIAHSAATPRHDARAAGLTYETDLAGGIRRRRRGRSFEYVDPRGHVVHERWTLRRIAALVIPPAWTKVWISSKQNAHLQATGRDAKRRKQYRYHVRWREVRDETKFDRMLTFGQQLPKIRARVERDVRSPRLTRAKLLATVVRLLDLTLIRVGNEEYARANDSYGLTTLRERHVRVRGDHVHFHFRGKSGKVHEIDLENARLAKIVRRCQEIPGHELFHYLDDGGSCRLIESADVNDYLRTVTAHDFTAKDFRTWAGTVLAAAALAGHTPSCSTQAHRQVSAMLRAVAARLGNTPAVCRKSYIHPAIFEAFQAGRLGGGASKNGVVVRGSSNDVGIDPDVSRGRFVKGALLHEQELYLLHFLERHHRTAVTSSQSA